VTTQLPSDELDCDEGCSDDGHKHKWEIEPHPYNSDFDVYVTDDDSEALLALQKVAEDAWDGCEPGQEKVIKIRHNTGML
jgi:hypothetical protein